MNILAIETSTTVCSVALTHEQQVYTQHQLAPMRHTELILTMIDSLLVKANLKSSQLQLLAFGCGPGSFTGLRLAAAVVQALGLAFKLPVVPISTLQILAQGAYGEWGSENVLIALDARRDEIYWGAYCLDSNGLMQPQMADCLLTKEQLPTINITLTWSGIGNGWLLSSLLAQSFASQLSRIESDYQPQASNMLELAKVHYSAGKFVNAEQAAPVYLGNADLWKKIA